MVSTGDPRTEEAEARGLPPSSRPVQDSAVQLVLG